jgi:hypothetical protein
VGLVLRCRSPIKDEEKKRNEEAGKKEKDEKRNEK